MLLRHTLHVVPFFSLSNWMDKTFCLQFWCHISFTLNRSVKLWIHSSHSSQFPQVIMRPRSGCPPYTTAALQTLWLINTLISYCKQFTFVSKLKVLRTLDAPASRKKKKRLISFQMGELHSSLWARTVRSEHDLINFWLWTAGVELWPNQCAYLEGKTQATSRLSIP